MKWSWRLGRFAGIDVDVHATFAFLLAWIGLAEYNRSQDATAVLLAVLFILAVFASVVLHEYGHALTARRYGIGTRKITILPIGGVASLERMPDEPRQELVIAVAGPLVNVVIAALLYGLLQVLDAPVMVEDLDSSGGPFVTRLMWVNIGLVLFNILPAFPMDGGRILRAGLALRLDYVRATKVAANVGRAFALLFGIFGLFNNPFLVFIAIFVWIGATGESAQVEMTAVLRGIPVDRIMIRDLRLLGPNDPLARAVEHLLAGFQQDFPVVEGKHVIGVLTRTDLLKALAARGEQTLVRDVMQTDFCLAKVGEPLEVAFARLRERGCQTMPVLQDDNLAGVLTLENVGEYFAIQGARRGSSTGSDARALQGVRS